MAIRLVFEDENNNQMDCFLNSQGRVYIGVGQKDEEIVYNGYITLDRNDVQQLIRILTECEKEMKD